jgi:hypothetical protein
VAGGSGLAAAGAPPTGTWTWMTFPQWQR